MTGTDPTASGSHWPRTASWAITMLALVAIVWFAVDLLRQCTPTAVVQAGSEGAGNVIGKAGTEVRATLKSIGDVLKPSVTNTPLVVLRGDDATPKLVVFTHLADVAVDLVEDHWYGDTYSRVEAKNCRVQFIVPVDRMGDRDIVFVPGQEGEPARIVVLAPHPRVDGEMLAIVPESIEFTERNSGLRYARSWLGIDNRDQLVRQIRPRLLEAVSRPEVRAKAEEAARRFFEQRFTEWLRGDLKLGRDVTVDIRWTE